MNIDEYFDAIKTRLLTDEVIAAFHIVRERRTSLDGHLRARLTLSDDSRLEFAEYVQLSVDGQIRVVTYNYHWADAADRLIQRWDNTPHHPDVSNFPHHIHTSTTDIPTAGRPVDIFVVLDEIATRLK